MGGGVRLNQERRKKVILTGFNVGGGVGGWTNGERGKKKAKKNWGKDWGGKLIKTAEAKKSDRWGGGRESGVKGELRWNQN